MASLDSKKTLLKHRELIRRKPILNRIYREWYRILKKKTPKAGEVVELGSGAGFIKDILPRTITTDVVKGPDIDRVINAERLPFRNGSVSAFVMVNTFHHIKNPLKALLEMRRCLKKGGKIIMIEPWNTIWSRFIYKNFHHEQFDEKAGWKTLGKNRLSDANGAIPWIIFQRDLSRFKKDFLKLPLDRVDTHTPFKYIISGGLSYPQLAPTFTLPLASHIDSALKSLGMFATIVLKKL